MSEITFADGVGMLGAALIVTTYFLLQVDRLDSRSLSFSLANGLGASGIIFSLFFRFNLSAFAIELFWLIISLYGVFRALRLRNSLSDDVVNSKDAQA